SRKESRSTRNEPCSPPPVRSAGARPLRRQTGLRRRGQAPALHREGYVAGDKPLRYTARATSQGTSPCATPRVSRTAASFPSPMAAGGVGGVAGAPGAHVQTTPPLSPTGARE